MSPLTYFESLGLSERAHFLLEQGVLVKGSSFEEVTISLYRIEQTFFELWYDQYHDRVVSIEKVSSAKFPFLLKHLLEDFHLN